MNEATEEITLIMDKQEAATLLRLILRNDDADRYSKRSMLRLGYWLDVQISYIEHNKNIPKS